MPILTVSVADSTFNKLDELVQLGEFRSRSHATEDLIKIGLKEIRGMTNEFRKNRSKTRAKSKSRKC